MYRIGIIGVREKREKERKAMSVTERGGQQLSDQDTTTAFDLKGRTEDPFPKVATLCRGGASSCLVAGVLPGDHVVGPVRCSSSVSYVETLPSESKDVLSAPGPETHWKKPSVRLIGRGWFVTESKLMSRLWLALPGNSHVDTREKDFFFRRGGRSTSGRGGASGGSSCRARVGVLAAVWRYCCCSPKS